jgi:hypothetical protein
MTIVSIALVADEWYVGMTPAKTALVNGTLIGYVMLSIVIILGTVLDIPLDRKLVSSGHLLVHSFAYEADTLHPK